MPSRVKIGCLCGRVKLEVDIAASTLPVEVGMCHCNSCRRTTGMVGVSYVPLDSKITDLDGLSAYSVSEAATSYFCRTCGAHCLVKTHADGGWHAGSGVISHVGPPTGSQRSDVVTINQHWHVDDTVDGGIVGRLTQIAGRQTRCYGGDPAKGSKPMEVLPRPPKSDEATTGATSTDDRLQASCQCGGVEFYLVRPKKRGFDLEDFWLKGEDTKYIAKFCVCDSCRLASGFPLQPWTYAPRSELVMKDSSALNLQAGTLQAFESSPDTFRYFCSKCGATVFYRSEVRSKELGYDLIDISIGILRGAEGVRAESWLEWWFSKISHRHEGADKELVDAIAGDA